MSAHGEGSSIAPPDSDYEYEYDENETETFYVDIDMTSTHGLLEHPNKKRKFNETGQAGAISRTPATSRRTPQTRQESADLDGNEVRRDASETPQSAPPANEGVPTQQSDIQILSLDTLNPIISYRGQYFSCTWSDIIGTNLFFSEPYDTSSPTSSTSADPPLISGQGFDLQGTSRVKLIAQKARVTARPIDRQKRPRNEDDLEHAAEDESDGPSARADNGKSLGTLTTNNAMLNREIKKQANFLERLMDIKRQKGETDNVRTVFKPTGGTGTASRAQASSTASGSGPKDQNNTSQRTKADYAREIERLNRKVVRGDREALFRLEEIYETMERDEAETDEEGQMPAVEDSAADNIND